jgi:cytochrome c-type biogenesis protein CcmE
MKKRGAVISGLVALLAGIGLIGVFVANASPYVTIAQAKQMSGGNLHLKGHLIKESLISDAARREIRFLMKDEAGDTLRVVHVGTPPSNMANASEVVVIGGMKGSHFESQKMLVKCPSKYENEPNVLHE